MKEYTLFRAIGSIGEDLIAEGADDAAFRAACRPRLPRHMRGLLAACLALVVLVVPLFHLLPAMLPARGGNAAPPNDYSGAMNDQCYGNEEDDSDGCFSLQLTELRLTPLPAYGGLQEGVTLHFALPGNLAAYDELTFFTTADGLQISCAQLPLIDASLDKNGNRSFSLTLTPGGGAAQGEIVCRLVGINSVSGETVTCWNRTYRYFVTDNWLRIEG